MSYAATPSPLNPLRAALGQCKADRERCENEIDTLVAERERISSMLPELRRQQNAQTEKVETLDRELHIYDCAIKDLEDQFGPLLGTRVELKEAAEVRAERYADAAATCSLPQNAPVVATVWHGGAVHILSPVVGFVDEDKVPEPASPPPSSASSASSASGERGRGDSSDGGSSDGAASGSEGDPRQ